MMTPIRGRGSQEFRPRVCYKRYGLPNMDVYISRVEGRHTWSGPQGNRDHVLRLQRPFRRLEEPRNMWLRARRIIGDFSRVFSRR
jgi:hypothetical protein